MIPVVISPYGLGIPVKQVESGAPVMKVSEHGLGIPIVLAEWGAPFIVMGIEPPENLPGPIIDLTVLSTTTSTAALAFTDAQYATSHEYSLDEGDWEELALDKIITGLDPDTTYDVQVRGVNEFGVGPASNTVQAVTQEVPVDPPVNTSAPTISGAAQVGETLTATPGSWTNSPDSYAYQWQRNAGSWADITGATSSTYELIGDDEGATIRVQVIATNSGGDSDPAYSDATATVTPAEPPIEADFYMMDGGTGDGLTPETAGSFATVWAAAADGDVIALVGDTTVPQAHTWNKSVTITAEKGADDLTAFGDGGSHPARFERLHDLIFVPPNAPGVESINYLSRVGTGKTLTLGNVRCTFPYWPGVGETWLDVGVARSSAWIGSQDATASVVMDGAEFFHGYGPTQEEYDPAFKYPEFNSPDPWYFADDGFITGTDNGSAAKPGHGDATYTGYNTPFAGPYLLGVRFQDVTVRNCYLHDLKEGTKLIAAADSEYIFEYNWMQRFIGDYIRVQTDTDVTNFTGIRRNVGNIMLDPIGTNRDAGDPHVDFSQEYATHVSSDADDICRLQNYESSNNFFGITKAGVRGIAQTHFWQVSSDHHNSVLAVMDAPKVRNNKAVGATYKGIDISGTRDPYTRNNLFVNPTWWDSGYAEQASNVTLNKQTYEDTKGLVLDTIAEGYSSNLSMRTEGFTDTGLKGADIDHDLVFADPSAPVGSITPAELYAKYLPIGDYAGQGPQFATLREMLFASQDYTGEAPHIGLVDLVDQEAETQVASGLFYLHGGDVGDSITCTLPSGVEMQQYASDRTTVLEAWTNTPSCVVGRYAAVRATSPAAGDDTSFDIVYGGVTFPWSVASASAVFYDRVVFDSSDNFEQATNTALAGSAGKTGTIAIMGYKTTHSGSTKTLYTSNGGISALVISQTTTGEIRVLARGADGSGESIQFQTTIAVNDGVEHNILIAFDTAEASTTTGATIMVDNVDRTESYFTWVQDTMVKWNTTATGKMMINTGEYAFEIGMFAVIPNVRKDLTNASVRAEFNAANVADLYSQGVVLHGNATEWNGGTASKGLGPAYVPTSGTAVTDAV